MKSVSDVAPQLFTKVLMSVIFVPVISVLSVLTLTWLKAFAEGAGDVFDCTVKCSTSHLHSCGVIHQTSLEIFVAYIDADWGSKS